MAIKAGVSLADHREHGQPHFAVALLLNSVFQSAELGRHRGAGLIQAWEF